MLIIFYSCNQETQDRTRKRIKEDLKVSTETYVEYADSVLPRLKRNYLRKCQEAEVNSANVVGSSLISLFVVKRNTNLHFLTRTIPIEIRSRAPARLPIRVP